MDYLITCSMCGHRFDPKEHIVCNGCPMQKGCQLVCCPACGYETVDVNRSILVRLTSGWGARLQKRMGWQKNPVHNAAQAGSSSLRLTNLSPGKKACVIGFAPELSNERRLRLQAYGLVPGQSVHVVQHSPVTIVLIEHLELALETDLARSVLIEG